MFSKPAKKRRAMAILLLSVSCVYVLSCTVYSEWIPAATSHKQCNTVQRVMVATDDTATLWNICICECIIT